MKAADLPAKIAPTVSIGLPVYNGEDFLGEAINSILGQTFEDFELIISDNGSTDATMEICQSYVVADRRVRYLRYDENRGAAWNFNNAFAAANGRYFQWAAHDDVYDPRFIESALKVLEEQPTVVLCFAQTDFIDETGHVMRSYPFPMDINHASRDERFLIYASGSHIVHEIFGLIRADALKESPLIGNFSGSDKILLGFLALRGRFYQIPQTLFFHREHSGRSTKLMAGAENYTQWFDASKSGKYAAPFLRRTFEFLGIVLGAPLTIGEKLRCLWQICRAFRWRWRDAAREITMFVRCLVGRL